MAPSPECPICHGPLDDLKDVVVHHNTIATSQGSVPLSGLGLSIVEALLRHRSGLAKDRLLWAYGAEGGPLTADKSILVTLVHLRRKLSKVGLTIRNIGGVGRGGGFYILERVQ